MHFVDLNLKMAKQIPISRFFKKPKLDISSVLLEETKSANESGPSANEARPPVAESESRANQPGMSPLIKDWASDNEPTETTSNVSGTPPQDLSDLDELPCNTNFNDLHLL